MFLHLYSAFAVLANDGYFRYTFREKMIQRKGIQHAKKRKDGGRETDSAEGSTAGVRMVRRQYFQLLPYQVLLIVVNAVNGMWTGLLHATASARRP